MAVTDIVRPEIMFDGCSWSEDPPDLAQAIDKYNKGRRRFLYYPWGVWVTAHARRALFSGIKAFGSDYIYSDTDSIKAINGERHQDYINAYNAGIIKQLEIACSAHGINPAAIRPKTIKGVEKPLGVWDFEGIYERWKTLGAKRYMTLHNGKLSITVSGVNKKTCVPWMLQEFGSIDGAFKAFDDGLYIPAAATGKNTHTYIDEPRRGIVTDYTGRSCEYDELSSVHLSGADYSLRISKLYADYLRGFRYE